MNFALEKIKNQKAGGSLGTGWCIDFGDRIRPATREEIELWLELKKIKQVLFETINKNLNKELRNESKM